MPRLGALRRQDYAVPRDDAQAVAWFRKAAAQGKSIDFNTSHARSAFAGVQWVIESGKDYKVERMSGDVRPGGVLSGRIVGSRGKTSWTFDFDLTLPEQDAAAGLSCKWPASLRRRLRRQPLPRQGHFRDNAPMPSPLHHARSHR